MEGARLIAEPPKCLSNYWLQTIMLDIDQINQRDVILQITNDMKLTTRPVWRLMHFLTPFVNCPRMDLSGAELLAKRLINIPSSPDL